MEHHDVDKFWLRLTRFRADLPGPQRELLDALVDRAVPPREPEVQGYGLLLDDSPAEHERLSGYERWLLARRQEP